MPGTLVHDALAPELYDGTAITSATTTTGSAVKAPFYGDAQVEVAYGTLTGTGVSIDIEIEAAWDSGFTQGVVSLGSFPTADELDDDETKAINVFIDSAYLRAVIVTAGTVTSVTPTVKVREPHLNRTPAGPGFPTAPGTGTGYPDAAD